MSLYHARPGVRLLLGDAHEQLAGMAGESADCIVTSPPYWGLRDYQMPGQYGQEATAGEYVERLRAVFAQARRVLAADGTCWLVLSDCYGGSWGNYIAPGSTAPTAGDQRRSRRHGRHRPPATRLPAKSLLGLPWRVADALAADGWTVRNAVVWHKPNARPESVADRLASRYELVFLLVRSRRYWFDLDALRQPAPAPPSTRGSRRPHRQRHHRGRNPGDVWSIPTRPFRSAHFAVFPLELPLRCIAGGCKPAGTVLDPFTGAGSTALAARQLDRQFLGVELNPAYLDLAVTRLDRQARKSPGTPDSRRTA